ncbi:MAG TPA: class III extradiol ring-cleavage dioxygenase [Bacteroidia bacterium]|jgi:4,5-DOPA dioxygenase extradiol
MSVPGKITPALFVSHGSPMNAIAENKYTQDLNALGRKLSDVSAVLVISAHWETDGLYVTSSETLGTYHDFRGFPQELFDVEYPVRAALHLIPVLEGLSGEVIKRDETRGLDHGAWSMLVHLFPEKNIGVLQLSMDMNKSFEEHYEFAKKLASLREQNVLVLASGNMTHNFSYLDFSDENRPPFDWALKFDELVKEAFLRNDAEALVKIKEKNKELFSINHPADDHFIPLLYLMGIRNGKDKVDFPHMSWQYGTLSMRHILLN